MNKLFYVLFAATFTCMSTALLTDAEKRSLAQEKLAFIDSQKIYLDEVNYINKSIYKQAQDVAAYILKDDFATVKQQIKSAVSQILGTQECIDYYRYKIMLTLPLIGRDNIKAKSLPILRPHQALSKKINDILASTIPVALLGRIEILTYFETYLNYKMDLLDAHLTITKFRLLEKELEAFIASIENETL